MIVRRHCSTPPRKKVGWNHSERVLVYYEVDGELNLTDTWGIAYYHYNPPFDEPPGWVDFQHPHRAPTYWWELPAIKIE